MSSGVREFLYGVLIGIALITVICMVVDAPRPKTSRLTDACEYVHGVPALTDTEFTCKFKKEK